MTTTSAGIADWPTDGDRLVELASAPMRWIVRSIVLCVLLQLTLTLVLPDQQWSMPLGTACLCFICAATIVTITLHRGEPDRFAPMTMAASYALLGLMWLVFIHDMAVPVGTPSPSGPLSFLHQILVIVFLVPRGMRFGDRGIAIADLVLAIVLGGLVTRTMWPQMNTSGLVFTSRFVSYLTYCIYTAIGLASLYVQRRSPPPFLRAFAISQCVYAATSILSVELDAAFVIARNSPIWIYGDTALILFPLLSIAESKRRPVAASTPVDSAPNQAVPFVIAVLIMGLAMTFAHNQQTLMAVIGIAGLLLFSGRVAYVTQRYHHAQDAVVAAGRARVESLIDVVHELRSPLASVVLNASALARADDIPPRLKDRADTIANRCGTVTRLLNDVLDLERIEAGVMAVAVGPVDVARVCRDAVEGVATTARAAGVMLAVDARHATAQADAGLLSRVIINLLDNAIRFTPRGGAISVSVSVDETTDGHVAIIVEDSGVGLSPEARATLFQRFAHAGIPVNGSKGSGLGLSISSSAIAAMGGQLCLTAREDGPGTRATIMLQRDPIGRGP